MEALPLTMGLLTRSPIQINLQIKLAVDKWSYGIAAISGDEILQNDAEEFE